jgi:hypothetical protein
MQTLFEYESTLASTPEYRLNRPNGCHSFMAFVEHEEGEDDAVLLERIFSLCNRGSGKEHEQFKVTQIPSLSVGDYVKLGCKRQDLVRTYRCESFGWKLILD